MAQLPSPTLLIRDIGALLTLDSSRVPYDPLGILHNAALVASGDQIIWVGTDAELTSLLATDAFAPAAMPPEIYTAHGRLVTPGLIDPHTHIVFAGSRAREFQQKHRGVPMATILAEGGGINATVRATRAASDTELIDLAQQRLGTMRDHGVTTAEIKTGYGLNVEQEERLLHIINSLAAPDLPSIEPTLLAAHAIPPEYANDRTAYMRLVVEEMVPRFALAAHFCDIYCETGYFSPEETSTILRAAQLHGYRLKVHANQLGHSGGAQLAATYRAISADHLDFVTDADLDALAAAGTVGVLLPGCSLAGNLPYPPVARYLQHGVRIALASNCNPGTSYCENLQLVMTLAIAHMGMTATQAWQAVTVDAAAALDRADIGVLMPGKRCDLAVWNCTDHEEIGYRVGTNLVRQTIIGGEVINP